MANVWSARQKGKTAYTAKSTDRNAQTHQKCSEPPDTYLSKSLESIRGIVPQACQPNNVCFSFHSDCVKYLKGFSTFHDLYQYWNVFCDRVNRINGPLECMFLLINCTVKRFWSLTKWSVPKCALNSKLSFYKSRPSCQSESDWHTQMFSHWCRGVCKHITLFVPVIISSWSAKCPFSKGTV